MVETLAKVMYAVIKTFGETNGTVLMKELAGIMGELKNE